MAAGILVLLRKVRLFSGSRPPVLGRYALGSRPPFSPEEEEGSDNERDEEQEIMSIMKKREKAIRFKRMQREMEASGPPERRLTWNAMEQIKYLKQELPEEWTIERLADGFNVSTDVIRRVLRSRYIPSEARKIKQDAAVSRNLGQISSSTRHEQVKSVSSSKQPTQQLLARGGSDQKLLESQSPASLPSPKISDSSIAVRTEGTQIQMVNTLVPQNLLQRVQQTPPSPAQSHLSPNKPEEPVPSGPTEEEWKMLDGEWDGEILSDQDLEELARSGLENKMKVVQKGREFFDSDGNFLYSI